MIALAVRDNNCVMHFTTRFLKKHMPLVLINYLLVHHQDVVPPLLQYSGVRLLDHCLLQPHSSFSFFSGSFSTPCCFHENTTQTRRGRNRCPAVLAMDFSLKTENTFWDCAESHRGFNKHAQPLISDVHQMLTIACQNCPHGL